MGLQESEDFRDGVSECDSEEREDMIDSGLDPVSVCDRRAWRGCQACGVCLDCRSERAFHKENQCSYCYNAERARAFGE